MPSKRRLATAFIAVIVTLAIPVSACAEGPRDSGATLGEGGRDLVPRLRWVAGTDWHPHVAVELHGDAGWRPRLLGLHASYMRLNPVLGGGFAPTTTTTVFAGVGPGAAAVGPRSDAAVAVEERVAVTSAAVFAARYTGAALPMLLEWRVDSVGGRGTAAMLLYAIELSD